MPHDRLDRRSLALHRAIAEKLRSQPELLEIAWDNLNRWSAMKSSSQPYLDQWRTLLQIPLEDLLALLQEDSPRMTDLRQASPFAGVLAPKERWHIYDTFAANEPALVSMDGLWVHQGTASGGLDWSLCLAEQREERHAKICAL